MNRIEDDKERRSLYNQILFDREPLTKGQFFQEFWRSLSSFVRHNKENPLLRESVKKHPDLIPRTFAIICAQYGAFTYQPSRFHLLSAFVSMLDEDLVEEELLTWEYSTTQDPKGAFFPGLAEMLNRIHDIYGMAKYRPEDLPPSPYMGFAFLALNHSYLFDTPVDLNILGKKLNESHLSMLGVLLRTKPE